MRKSALERFEEKYEIDSASGCWVWTAGYHSDGYSGFWDGERYRLAYGVMWEWTNGPIPDGLQLDHLCRNRRCVNPDHLELVTPRENILRGAGMGARFARRTHCDKGHPLAGYNLKIRSDGARRCRTCKNANERARYARQRG